ncbi:MAG: RagB/SusD family nutrient uptake outer membrane protein, partial [Bacteroidetes bacterium]|nr:RagB/SusD family nutrient uptake outer membrane protein [Bacteroidota bacterium]
MKKIIGFFLLISLLSACHNRLNIEPEQAISVDVALSNEQGIRTALVGTYDLLSQMPTPSGDVILNSELFADTEDLIWTSYILQVNQVFNKKIAVSNTAVEHFWIYSYQTINQANTVLDAVEVLEEADQDGVAAELRFIRAMVYFDLVNMYAMPWTAGNPKSNLGVPIISTPAEQTLENPEVPRNTVAEVYQ